MEEEKKYQLFVIFLALFVVLAYFLVRPFISAIVGALVISYFFYPLYNIMNKKIKNQNLCAIIIVVIIFLIITVPLIIVGNVLAREASELNDFLKTGELTQKLSANQTCAEGLSCSIAKYISGKMSDPSVLESVTRLQENVSSLIIEKGSNFLISLPEKILLFFVMLFITFYLLIYGRTVVEFAKEILPVKEEHKTKVFIQFKELIHATIYGTLIIAVVQGLVAGIGYFLFGVKSFIFLSLLTMLASLVPFVGTSLVWLPLSVQIIVQGILVNDNPLMIKGIGLLAYGTLIVGTIDNILKPFLIGDRAKVNPVLILVGAFGGLKMFGFFGIFIGPIILVLLLTFLKIYLEESKK